MTVCFNTTLDLQSFLEAVPKINAAKKAQRVGPDQSTVKSTTTMKAISSRGPCNSIQAGTSRPSRGQRMQQEGFGNHAAGAAKNVASLFSPVPQSMLAPRKSARNQSGSGKNYAERNDDDDDDVEITNLRQADNRTFGRATRTSSDSALLELPPRVCRPSSPRRAFPAPACSPACILRAQSRRPETSSPHPRVLSRRRVCAAPSEHVGESPHISE